ncbi:MAG: peptidoglycan-binding protein [Pseudomonadota bacterium]
MGIEQAIARPPRCVLVNVATGESVECLFNPTQLTEKLQVNWNRLAVPGLSHQVLQFQGTGNRQLTGVEFYLDRLFAAEQPGDPDIMGFRRFLRSLTVPPGDTEGVIVTAPARALFVWPGVLSVEAVLTEVEFQYRQFGVDGRVLVYAATCSFEEILDVRISSEELQEEA